MSPSPCSDAHQRLWRPTSRHSGCCGLISSSANHVSGKAADPQARGWWKNECFHLRTTLDRDALRRFFLYDYAPSPIIAPWNGRAGFLEGDEGEASGRAGASLMSAVEESQCLRLKLMKRTVLLLRNNNQLTKYDSLRALVKTLTRASKDLKGSEKNDNDAEARRVEKQAKAVKSQLLPSLRSETDSYHVDYIDACFALSDSEVASPLLGSGGNDGSRDFGVNFAEGLKELIDFSDGGPKDGALDEFEAAVFGVVRRAEKQGSMGQFNPGQGGPNATTGYKGENPLNSWDVVLALEGTLVFAGALTRHWGYSGSSKGAFPFTFEPTRAGSGNQSMEDQNPPRGEVWTPVWTKPAAQSEVAATFAEGRLTLGGRMARTGLDAARSVARIGTSRGITGFERYSIIQPDSKMPYQATPLGRFNVPDRPRRDLVGDLEAGDWLNRARRLVESKTSPASARRAVHRLEDALFEMTAENRRSEGARNALVAIGNLVAWISKNPDARKELKPPPVISPAWIQAADDGSPEIRIAAALAGMGLPGRRVAVGSVSPDVDDGESGAVAISQAPDAARPPAKAAPMAAHLAPLDEKKFFHRGRLNSRRAWSDGDKPPTAVWGAGTLVSNMIEVLERRLIDASIRGLEDKPLDGAAAATLADVAAFFAGDFNDARCAALLAGMVWAQPASLSANRDRDDIAPLPFAYAALKPVFTPNAALHAVGVLPSAARMPVPRGILARLRASGDKRDGQATDLAVRTALARARASGLSTPFDAMRSSSGRTVVEGSRIGVGVAADRLAAALLIPIGKMTLTALLWRAYPGSLPENDKLITEELTNAN